MCHIHQWRGDHTEVDDRRGERGVGRSMCVLSESLIIPKEIQFSSRFRGHPLFSSFTEGDLLLREGSNRVHTSLSGLYM
jgi:hypothetical protein